MEKAHNTDIRRMLDKVAWDLSQFQGEDGNVESCTYEVRLSVIEIVIEKDIDL